jgi:hypothetical protein
MTSHLSLAKNALLTYYLPRRVFRRRWLLAIPFSTLLIAYIVFETLAIHQGQSAPNIWEMWVEVLNYPQILHHGMLNTLIYLMSGLGFVEPFEIQILFRIRSRKSWFRAQLLCIFASVVSYLALILLVTVIVSLPVVRWTGQWGDFSHVTLRQAGLPETLLATPPLVTVTFMTLLMGMAWVFVGVVTVFITTSTQRPTLGFLGGVALNYSMLIIAQSDAGWLQSVWPSNYLFLWKAAPLTGTPAAEFILSSLYWLLLIALGLGLSWKRTQTLNFMDKRTSDPGS